MQSSCCCLSCATVEVLHLSVLIMPLVQKMCEGVLANSADIGFFALPDVALPCPAQPTLPQHVVWGCCLRICSCSACLVRPNPWHACLQAYAVTTECIQHVLQREFSSRHMLVLSVSFSLPALLLFSTVSDPRQAHEQIYASSDFDPITWLANCPADPQQVLRLHLRMRRNMQRRPEETYSRLHTQVHICV